MDGADGKVFISEGFNRFEPSLSIVDCWGVFLAGEFGLLLVFEI